MVLHRLIYAIGGMTVAYMLSESSLTAAKKLEQSGNLKFLVRVLIIIYYFFSICSFLVGLFFHFQKEHTANLQKHIDELTKMQQESKEKSETLMQENEQLRDQLYHEAFRTEERSFAAGRKQGYVNGYSVGFEDCMDVLGLEQDHKSAMMPMARQSGIHRIKTRPTIFDNQKSVEVDGILR